ncbi:hypothetical protein TcCL_NonESM07808 [Trypanosoma cruzi]|nr:hypothetical protein TcCL_NonESM07808 [Trypanosoma cruzi]
MLSPRRVKHSLPLRPHGWASAEASYEQLSAISRVAAMTAPKKTWTHEMKQAESAAEAAHEAHTLPHLETAYFEPNVPEKREERNQALRRCSAVLLEARAKRCGASPSPSWRYLHGMAAPHPHPLESVVLRTDLGRVCALPRQQANLIVRHFLRFHVPHYPILLLLLAALLWFLVAGKWIGLSRRMNLT